MCSWHNGFGIKRCYLVISLQHAEASECPAELPACRVPLSLIVIQGVVQGKGSVVMILCQFHGEGFCLKNEHLWTIIWDLWWGSSDQGNLFGNWLQTHAEVIFWNFMALIKRHLFFPPSVSLSPSLSPCLPLSLYLYPFLFLSLSVLHSLCLFLLHTLFPLCPILSFFPGCYRQELCKLMCERLKLSTWKVQLGVLQSMNAYFQG